MTLQLTNRAQHFAYLALVVGIALASACTLLFSDSDVARKDAGQRIDIIKAKEPKSGANFGFSMAISGDLLVVGAPGTDSNKGLAYVFLRQNDNWEMEQILNPMGIEDGDRFGHSVAIDGTTIVVGANGEDGAGDTIVDPGGFPTDNGRPNAGAVSIFERAADESWALRAYLKSPASSLGTEFGFSVALRGEVLAVGEPSPAGGFKGSVYLYKKDSNNGEWTLGAQRSGTDNDDRFGHSVALSESHFAVGAPHEDSSSTMEDDNNASKSGAVYTYKLTTGTADLNEAAVFIKADTADADDEFGGVVALSGDLLAIGARFSGAPGESSQGPGKVYLFRQENGSSWTPNASTPILQASNPDDGDRFGVDIAISDADGTIIVSARQEDGGGRGLNPTDNNTSENSGAIYAFRRGDDSTKWEQSIYAKASNATSEDFYGTSVALSDEFILIGARKQDSLVTDSGAVYSISR